MLTKNQVETVAEKVFEKSETFLPQLKSGKWTVLASIVLIIEDPFQVEPLSIACGTKTIGTEQLSRQGFQIGDCHAEVLARRAFVAYLYDEMSNYKSSSTIQLDEGTGKLKWVKSGRSLYLYTSEIPCGDATALDCKSGLHNYQETSSSKRAKWSTESLSWIGAKCAISGKHLSTPGLLRLKPGKGYPSLSMSCSDKIAKWTVMGLQGSLPMCFLAEPIYLDGIITTCVSNPGTSTISMIRAFNARSGVFISDTESRFLFHGLNVYTSDRAYKFQRPKTSSCEPMFESLLWNQNLVKPEILVNGYMKGATRKQIMAENSAIRCQFCRFNLGQRFFDVWCTIQKGNTLLGNGAEASYMQLKTNMSAEYSQCWNRLKSYFASWISDPRKADLQNFGFPEAA